MLKDDANNRFYQFIWPYRSAILRVALIFTGNAAEAEDLAQDTLMKAFKAISTLPADANIKPWLMRILRNARIDRVRSQAASSANVSLDHLEIDPPDDRPALESSGQSLESRCPQDILNVFSDQDIINALQHLPEEIRWTLLLVDVEGLDHQDAATMLDVPVGTIKSRAHRGRAMLRNALLPLAQSLRMTDSTDVPPARRTS